MEYEDLKKLEKETGEKYFSIKSVYCPILNCNIFFNKYGWQHLRFGGNVKSRSLLDLERRLVLFPKAQKIISSKKCLIRSEVGKNYTTFYLTVGKITVMLKKKFGSEKVFYYSVWSHGRIKKKTSKS